MSIHIDAKKGDIAETVLLPGDPLRAKWIAEEFLENAVQYNNVRGMLGYTGTFQGKKISVQGTGMGIPSTLIYCHELINEFGVKNLIRVGSAGSYQEKVKINDVVIAMAASSTSGINTARFPGAHFSPTADFKLFMKAASFADSENIPVHAGNILSSDAFYEEDEHEYRKWAKFNILCVEMETAGIYTVAAQHGVSALSILTISDSLITKESLTSADREKSFSRMIKIALNTAE
ncbi:purine-nucleoside phosphorylase [Autumnicola psychrophila]|uniref:Uridine phosphorylase n=1 Tax=Autumnicola psychrophila TaxID=3075592 RepID=A0ABU3DUN2_9FLAO|nr:purine-nucleoside phosphorylase [Zunongwangia sp. F225]MDT0687425.1 purine-nucleoside phosphorylase [Zunongwangia sp. F225]